VLIARCHRRHAGFPIFAGAPGAFFRTMGPLVRIPRAHPFQKGSRMSSKIYVGNLPYSVTDSSLQSNFAEFGGVSSAKVMMDRETGRSKGFGFVEMASAEAAQAAIAALHGVSVDGRTIVVNLARPREATRSAGGYGAEGFRASQRTDVGYGNGGYGGGRY
jgi:RNA recognition motif-containing protein